jgi:SpoVK/Ycf46/Vps4 family AAA+-type ATPase
MSKRDWIRHGSPYDPSFQGKKSRPIKEEDPAQLRGCGDPSCASCNPHTADRYAIGGTVTSRSSPDAPFVTSDFRKLEEIIFAGMLRGNTPTPSPATAAYNAARELVKDHLQSITFSQSFDDVVGNEGALEELRNAIRAPIEDKELYEKYGLKMPKGALLYGPPGCGKTMFARAAAHEMATLYGDGDEGEFEFICVSGSTLQSPYVGETEAKIKAIFDFAHAFKKLNGFPLLVFIDECEVILPDRTGRVRKVAPWEESNVAAFIAEMDGVRESSAFVLLASNRPEVIDQAVLRDGRCDFKIKVSRPDHAALEVILQRSFEGIFSETPLEELVFAAKESLLDPNRIIIDFHALGFDPDPEATERFKLVKQKHFLLEHIISGAMAVSVSSRAKRLAFSRDKRDGTLTGVGVDDIIKAVNIIYDENKGLEHSFALEEFRDEFMREIQAHNEHNSKGKLH